MRSEKRGFFSIDAFFALMLLLVVTASFLNVYQGRKSSAETTDARLNAKVIGERLASAINATYAGGPSFELRVNLPENLKAHQYRITFDNASRQISVENSAWGAIKVGVTCKNVKNFTLGPENLKESVRILWRDNQITVVTS